MKPYSLAVKAIILNDAGQCLLLRRSATNRSFAGCWEWPGGKVDSGEEFVTALLREVREETGRSVEVTGFYGATTFDIPESHVVLICMEARLCGGDVRVSEEHDACEWVAFTEMGERDLPESLRPFMLSYAVRKLEATEEHREVFDGRDSCCR